MKKIFMDKNGALRIGWTLVISALLMFIPLIVIFSLGGLIFGNNETAQQILWGVVGTPVLIGLTTVILKKCFPKESYQSFDYTQHNVAKKFVVGFLLGVILIGAQVAILVISGQMQISYQGINVIRLFAGLATFTGMAVLEECIFRGLIQASCQKFSWPIAITLAAVFFTASHQDLWMHFSILRVVELFLSGVLFALVTRITNSITFSTGIHLAFNFFGAVILGVDTKNALFTTVPTTVHNAWTGIDGGGSIIGIGLLLVFIAGFIIYNNNLKKNKPALAPAY